MAGQNTRFVFALTGITLLALAIRILWLLWHGAGEITWDGAEYARIASNLASGHGYLGLRGTTNFVFPPLYPIAIATLLPIAGSAANAGLAISLLAGAAFVLPCYTIAATIFSRRTGYVAALVAACFPFAIQLSTVVLADMLFLTLVATGLAFLLRTALAFRIDDAGACGAALGLAYLTRPEASLFEGLAVVAILVVAFLHRGRPERVALLALAAIVPFVLLAAPYVTFLSSNAGHVRFEGKSLLNLDIGLRMDRGMSYAVAADAIDRNLVEVGPELHRDYYFEPMGRQAPPMAVVASFGLRNTVRHVTEIGHVALSRLCGTIVFALLALLGLAAGPWTRRHATGVAILLAYAAVVMLSLASVYHFWERYFVGFVPVYVVFAARGIDVLARRLEFGKPQLAMRFALPVTALFLAACAFSTRTGYTDDASTSAERQAGRWLAAHAVPDQRVLGISDQAVFYAHDVWSMLPWSPDNETALRYVRKVDPDYVILNSEYAGERPYVTQWIAGGIPDPAAHPVFRFKSGDTVLEIVRWQAGDQANR